MEGKVGNAAVVSPPTERASSSDGSGQASGQVSGQASGQASDGGGDGGGAVDSAALPEREDLPDLFSPFFDGKSMTLIGGSATRFGHSLPWVVTTMWRCGVCETEHPDAADIAAHYRTNHHRLAVRRCVTNYAGRFGREEHGVEDSGDSDDDKDGEDEDKQLFTRAVAIGSSASADWLSFATGGDRIIVGTRLMARMQFETLYYAAEVLEIADADSAAGARYTVRFGNGEERTGILAAELVVPDKLRLGQQVLAARQRMGYLSRAEIVGYGDLPGVHSTCFEVRFESDGHAQLCPPGDVAVKAFTSQDLTGMAHQSHKCAAPCGLDEVGAPIASPGMIALVDGGYGRGHAIDLGEDSPVGQPPMEVQSVCAICERVERGGGCGRVQSFYRCAKCPRVYHTACLLPHWPFAVTGIADYSCPTCYRGERRKPAPLPPIHNRSPKRSHPSSASSSPTKPKAAGVVLVRKRARTQHAPWDAAQDDTVLALVTQYGDAFSSWRQIASRFNDMFDYDRSHMSLYSRYQTKLRR